VIKTKKKSLIPSIFGFWLKKKHILNKKIVLFFCCKIPIEPEPVGLHFNNLVETGNCLKFKGISVVPFGWNTF
jgi:hypothetical protein